MFRDLRQEIDREIKRLKNTKDILEYLTALLVKTIKQRDTLDAELGRLNPVADAEEATRKRATQILLEEADLALKFTKEFNISIYRRRLEEAIKKRETIIITVVSNTINVRIDLNRTAGGIEDYANAISETRRILNVGKAPPDIASWFWEEKYYRPAREGRSIKKIGKKRRDRTRQNIQAYWNTIRLRASLFQTLAPFWELLDQGNISLSSDRGGTPYPEYGRTDFVRKAKLRIEELFYRVYSERVSRIQRYIETLDELEEKISYIQTLLDRLTNRPDVEQVLLGQIQRQLGEKFKFADPARVDKLISDLVSEVALHRRVELSASSKNRTRVRVEELRKIVRSYRSR